MAGLKLLRTRLRASSMIEVTTALVIISFAFSMSAVIYLRVEKSGFSSRKFAAGLSLDEVYANIQTSGNVGGDKTYPSEEVTIYQTVEAYTEGRNLQLLRLEARDENGKLIAVRKHLINEFVEE